MITINCPVCETTSDIEAETMIEAIGVTVFCQSCGAIYQVQTISKDPWFTELFVVTKVINHNLINRHRANYG